MGQHIENLTIQIMPSHADAKTAYTKRFDAALAHIDVNLEGDLSVDVLSRIANFSKFHFHRQFAAYVGATGCSDALRNSSFKAALVHRVE